MQAWQPTSRNLDASAAGNSSHPSVRIPNRLACGPFSFAEPSRPPRRFVAWLGTALLLFAGGVAASAASVCIEAEAATVINGPMHRVDAGGKPPPAQTISGASGEQYLEIPEGAGKPPKVGGDATLEFLVPENGTYILWARVWWVDECGNSIGMNIDAAPAFTFGQDTTYKAWHWVKAPGKLKQLELTAGKHSLKLSNREDGAAIDQILLTTDPKYVPVDSEIPTVPVTKNQATAGHAPEN